ncbi:MAG TPA: 50S ribosomal protein L4 [Oceanipulchritudo sp.]|nr:50S ribosomal protein L4 [Oceanipulchritudo sp.]
MKLKVFSTDGSSASEKDFPIPQFEGDKGLQALKQVILAVQANKRQGTVSTKTRRTVHGTGKKPFRQKGSGTARQGSKVGPQHYHGAVAHGPQPRDFSHRVSKKMRQVALSRALFDRVVDGEVAVIEKWEVTARKTKLFDELVGKIAPKGRILVLDDSWSDQNILAARNIQRLEVNEASDVNALDLSDYDQVIFSEKGLERLLTRLNGGN